MPKRRSEVARRTSKGDRETELRKRGTRALTNQANAAAADAELVFACEPISPQVTVQKRAQIGGGERADAEDV